MARYADSLLTEGEHVVLRTRQHWLALLIRGRGGIAVFILGLILIGLVLFLPNVFPAHSVQQTLVAGLGLLCLLIGVVVFLFRFWQWSNQDYMITNRRLLKVTGILSKHSGDSSLEKINDAILDQSLLGRMMNYGDLSILTAAEEAVDLYHMLNNPKEFKKVMLTQKHALETEFLYVGAMPPTPPLRADAPMQPQFQPAAPMHAPPPVQPTASTIPPAPMPSDPAPAASAAAADVASSQAAAQDKSLEITQTLARLADLRDSGAITAEEYEQKKDDLLDRL